MTNNSLKNLLTCFNDVASVRINLTSTTHVDFGEGCEYNSIDCCGNHSAIDWCNAIDVVGDFEVLSLAYSTYDHGEGIQIDITINHKKDDITKQFGYVANNCAIRRVFTFAS